MSADVLTPDRYINRELSWIAFNERVLAQPLIALPAGSGQIQRHLQQQPRRILHGARGVPEVPG